MANNIDKNKEAKAKKIAKKQAKRFTSSYENLEAGLLRLFRSFSTIIDHILFQSRYTALVALGLAAIMFSIVNFNSNDSVFGSTLLYSKSISNVSVTAKYSETTYELSGLPSSCNVTLIGDAGNVTTASTNSGYCLVNLEGLVEGTHTVALEAIGYGDAVNKVITPTNVTITLKKKTTGQFAIGYDFINTDEMEDIYVLGTPEFEVSKINVRASQDTLDSIAFVKALIDVSGVTDKFTQEAKLVAYDTKGLPVDADIVPESVSVTVDVKSPSKTVPINLETTGEVPDNLAIESIVMDHQTVTIYAPESVLSKVEQVTVSIDAATLTKNTKIVQPIILPTGVSSSNITKVNLDITLGEIDSKLVEDVTINYENNLNNYKFEAADKTTASVMVYGTVNNIAEITASDIEVYFDMTDAVIGDNEFVLHVVQNTNPYIRYELMDASIKGVIVGDETTEEEN